MPHGERHRSERIGWLRAAVLGANDGIVSTASLVVGVAAAEAARQDVLVAGVAGLVAGAPVNGGRRIRVGEFASGHRKGGSHAGAARAGSRPQAEEDELTGIYIRERSGHTLQPTALVHEVYLRLVDQDRAMWRNRAQFLAIASEMMRRILVDRARARKMAKRSGGLTRVTLVEDAARREPHGVDVLDLDAALDELSSLDPRKARVAELRLFGGLSLEETQLRTEVPSHSPFAVCGRGSCRALRTGIVTGAFCAK